MILETLPGAVSNRYFWYWNLSIHKSNKIKEHLARQYHPRIQLVILLPTRSPELNLIEVRWL
jgi:hypothetical protein